MSLPSHTNADRLAEELRILAAVRDNKLCRSDSARWIILGDTRPERKRREALAKNGYMEKVYGIGGERYRLTHRGTAMLKAHDR